VLSKNGSDGLVIKKGNGSGDFGENCKLIKLTSVGSVKQKWK